VPFKLESQALLYDYPDSDLMNYYDNYINDINYMLTDTNRWDCKKRLLMISLICKDEIKNIY
jgi:hypothetical protein